MEEGVLDSLFEAFERNGDVGECVEIVARNFPVFAENEALFSCPEEVIVNVLSSEHLVLPDPEKTVDIFLKLFQTSREHVSLYFPLVPIDDLTKDQAQRLANALDEMKCPIEARQMKRVVNMYQMIDDSYSHMRSNDEKTTDISEKLSHSTDILSRMTNLLQQTTDSLNRTTDELQKKTEELTKKEEEITKLKFLLKSKR